MTPEGVLSPHFYPIPKRPAFFMVKPLQRHGGLRAALDDGDGPPGCPLRASA